MPQRPFFAIGRRDEDKIREIFNKAIRLWVNEKVLLEI
jgi:phage gpG-like protein